MVFSRTKIENSKEKPAALRNAQKPHAACGAFAQALYFRLVTNRGRQARGCTYHGWRSGWEHWSPFWVSPPKMSLDLRFSTSLTLKKSVKTCIEKYAQF